MNAEANDIGLGVLMKALDFQIPSRELYRINLPGVNLNKKMNRTTSLNLYSSLTSGTDILPEGSVYDKVRVTKAQVTMGQQEPYILKARSH